MKGTIEVGKDGIIYAKMADDNVEGLSEWTEALKRLVRQRYQITGRKVKVLTDLSGYGVSDNIELREIVSDMFKANEPYVKKSAAYTQNFALRAMSNIVARVGGRKNFIVFRTKEEALEWLNAEEKGKKKEDVIRETVHEAYKFLKESPDNSQEEILNYVSRLHDYSAMETDAEFEAYNTQQGVVLVAYNYIKQKPNVTEDDATDYILEKYVELLNRYSAE